MTCPALHAHQLRYRFREGKPEPARQRLAIVQLRDHPAHEFWADGKSRAMLFAPAGSLSILDLRQESAALFRKPMESLHVYLPRAALDDLAEDVGALPLDHLSLERTWVTDRTMQQFAPILVDALDAPAGAARPYLDHLILAVANHVASSYGEMRPSAFQPGALAPWQVRRAKEMLAADLSKDIPLLEVASACGLSLSYFSRAFKTATGTTPHCWRQTCRIERARELLHNGSLSLAEIAVRCGFADQSHFTRIFKRSTGHGPGAWRRLRSSDPSG